MKLVIQRVLSASVEVPREDVPDIYLDKLKKNDVYGSEKIEVGSIGQGLLVFLGVGREDTEKTADLYIDKLLKLRIFADENGRTNRSLADVSGELLIISQFTLYADCRHGNRPSFTDAGDAKKANQLYKYFVEQCGRQVRKVETGVFGADMKVSLVNDGPFTIVLDETLMKGKA